ncbi:MAG TPA: autotransporter-associated beta strand repeat-containing protein, partial [Thermoanaerobaculia bacterium]
MRTSRPLVVTVCAVLLATVSHSVRATTYTWQGGGGTIDWSDAGNWAGGTPPLSDLQTTDLIFGNAGARVSSRIAPSFLFAPFSIRGLTFTSDASIYTFSGGPLRIGSGGITHNALNEQTFNAQILLGLDQTWRLGSNAGALRMSGNVDLAGRTLTIDAARTGGSGNILDGNFAGSGGLIKTGAGTLTLGSFGSTFTGGTTVREGVLAFSSNGAFGSGGVTLAGGELRANVTATLGRTVTIGAGKTGTISAATGTNLTLQGLALYGDLALGSAGNTGTITLGMTSFDGSDPTGTLSINAGRVRVGTTVVPGFIQNLERTTIAAGATFDLNNFSVGIHDLRGAGSLVLGSIGRPGPDGVEGSTPTLALYSGNFSGTISGYGGLVKESNGLLILSGANTFSEGTTLYAGTLGIGHNSALGTAALQVRGAATLYADGGDRVLSQRVFLNSDEALTIGDGAGQQHRLTLAGPITGNGGLIKNGAGTLALTSNDNNFSGGLTLNGGTLAVAS